MTLSYIIKQGTCSCVEHTPLKAIMCCYFLWSNK